MLTSTIWLQDGVAYVFGQTFNPGPTHLIEHFSPSQQILTTAGGGWKIVPELNEPAVRADIARLLRWRESFDRAVDNPNASARIAELAHLLTSKDDVVIRNALGKLGAEGTVAGHALRALLEDDNLLTEHYRILDTLAGTRAKDTRLASIIRRESSYWKRTCYEKLDENWVRSYGDPHAYHYLRLISAIGAIHALGITSDLPAVREFGRLIKECQPLRKQPELIEAISPLLDK